MIFNNIIFWIKTNDLKQLEIYNDNITLYINDNEIEIKKNNEIIFQIKYNNCHSFGSSKNDLLIFLKEDDKINYNIKKLLKKKYLNFNLILYFEIKNKNMLKILKFLNNHLENDQTDEITDNFDLNDFYTKDSFIN